ncbi:unnamed protein product, partial [Prorocentrum cordatum]
SSFGCDLAWCPPATAVCSSPHPTPLTAARPKSAPWGFSEDGAATHAPRMVPPQPGRQFRPPPGWAPTNPTAPALEHWRVDNRWLNAPTKGLVYRRSPRVEDKCTSAFAEWGTVVAGIAEGDDWIRVEGMADDGQDGFLPVYLAG